MHNVLRHKIFGKKLFENGSYEILIKGLQIRR